MSFRWDGVPGPGLIKDFLAQSAAEAAEKKDYELAAKYARMLARCEFDSTVEMYNALSKKASPEIAAAIVLNIIS